MGKTDSTDPPLPERVATKCDRCNVDVIVSRRVLEGMKLKAPIDAVLEAISNGAASFKCPRCASLRR